LIPHSIAALPATSAATCAANGVDFLEPLKPCPPDVAQDNAKKQTRVQESLTLSQQIGQAGWVSVDTTKLEGVFKKTPDRDEISGDINESLIVELYSR
jgi:small subunit ribosomal protein S4